MFCHNMLKKGPKATADKNNGCMLLLQTHLPE